MSVFQMDMAICVLAAPFWMQLPANVLGKAAEDDSMTWSPAIHMVDLDDAPRSQLWLSPGYFGHKGVY